MSDTDDLLLSRTDDDASTSLRRLSPSEVKVRRRPRAILFVYAWQLLSALLVATPAHAWAKQLWSSHPDGDGVLFRPGGFDLTTWLLDGGAALRVVAESSWMLLFASVLLAQLPLAVLLTSLASGRGPLGLAPRTTETLRAAFALFAPFVVLLFLATLVQAITVGAGSVVASKIDAALSPSIGDAPAFGVRVGVLLAFVLIACVFGIEADLARAGMVRASLDRSIAGAPSAGLFRQLRIGLRAALRFSFRARLRLIAAWLARAVLALVLVFLGSLVADRLGGRGGGALVVLAAVHQAIVLARTVLRASWLACATRATAD